MLRKFLLLFAISVSSLSYAIVGTSYISVHDLPEQSCVIVYLDRDGEFLSLCSGTLLFQTHIKTAGHCESNADDSNNTYVICPIGEEKLIDFEERKKVISRRIHPEYVGEGSQHDIAVLEVESPFDITPMNYAKNEAEIKELLQNSECAIFGYGMNAQGKAGALLGTKAQIIDTSAGPHMILVGTSHYAQPGDSGGAETGISRIEELTLNLEWLNSIIPNTPIGYQMDSNQQIEYLEREVKRSIKRTESCLVSLNKQAEELRESLFPFLNQYTLSETLALVKDQASLLQKSEGISVSTQEVIETQKEARIDKLSEVNSNLKTILRECQSQKRK